MEEKAALAERVGVSVHLQIHDFKVVQLSLWLRVEYVHFDVFLRLEEVLFEQVHAFVNFHNLSRVKSLISFQGLLELLSHSMLDLLYGIGSAFSWHLG